LSNAVERFVLTCSDDQVKDLNVSFAARIFKVDRSHLSRQFSFDKGCLLSRFILIEKMRRAARFLVDPTRITIPELSERVGFFSAKHLSRVFKRYFGMVPSKYRILYDGGNEIALNFI
jgi:AraC-like DNA-binding protein